jgi:hypothetical protein
MLVAERPHNYDLSTCEMVPVGNMDGQNFYFFKRTRGEGTRGRVPCSSALPLFVSVVEYGKYRMSQFLSFLDKFMRPGSFRHCYSNIDNVILVLSESSLMECVKPELMEEFLQEKHQFFQPSVPGHLKLEWIEKSPPDWRFISGMTQNYSLISADSRHKNSALNHISSLQSYEASCAMLEKKPISFEQRRRTNKLANLDTVVKMFVYNK